MKTDIKLLSSKVEESLKYYRQCIAIEERGRHLERLITIFEKLGFRYLDEGIERAGFLFKDGETVLKVATSSDVGQNKHESNFAKNVLPYLPEELHKHFVLPIAHAKDYSWLLMPKADTFDTHDLTMEEANEVSKLMHQKFVNIVGDIDFHTGNVGKLNGVPVIIDYGFMDLKEDE